MTTNASSPEAQVEPQVSVDGTRIEIRSVVVDDAILAQQLAGTEPSERAALIERALAVGARGLATMGLGLDLAEVDLRVHRSVERVTEQAAQRVQSMLDEAHRVLTSSLDPEQRSSMVARTVADFAAWRDSFLAQVDPASNDSHTGRLLHHLQELLGPGGALEARLSSALDPESGGSGLGQVSQLIEDRFGELRELLATERGRREEADRGTAKGFEFEDVIEDVVRSMSRPLGAVVERTSRSGGSLAGDALVGDFVVDLPDLGRIVIEAKNVRSLALTGGESILGQLDRAIANRDAQFGICVSAQDAFPIEVGTFGVYGDRILVVDDGEGTMLGAALRWAVAALRMRDRDRPEIDVSIVEERLERMRMMAQRFSTNRRTLTEINASVDKVRDSLDGMRRDLIEMVDDATSALRAPQPAPVVELQRTS
jgi:hypothetical protein